MNGRFAIGVAVALHAAVAPLAAQQASLWLGGVYAHYADTVDGWAGSLGGRVGFQSPSAWGSADAYYTRFTSGEDVVDVSGGLGVLQVVSRRFGLGARAQGYGYYIEGGTWSGAGGVTPIVVTTLGRWIGSLELSVGGVRRLDETSDLTLAGALRAGRGLGRFNLDFSLSAVSAGDTAFGDGVVTGEYRTRTVAIGALAGARVGDLSGDPWVQGYLEWWPARALLFEARTGTYPEDITGFVSGFFARVGVRVGLVRPSRSAAPEQPPGPQIERLADGRARVVFAVEDATTVEIAGSWNAWTPTALTALGDDRWEAVVPLGPGAHRFSLVVNGERWIVPEGVPVLPDDFGGEVGLLVIPE